VSPRPKCAFYLHKIISAIGLGTSIAALPMQLYDSADNWVKYIFGIVDCPLQLTSAASGDDSSLRAASLPMSYATIA
jgi:hypothetical protein